MLVLCLNCIAFRYSHSSVKDRRQISTRRFIVKTDRHQSHLLVQAQAVLETPAKKFAVARRQQKAPTTNLRRCGDQCFDIVFGFAYGVGKEGNTCSITSDAAEVLDHSGPGLLERVA